MIRALLFLIMLLASLPPTQSDTETEWFYAHAQADELVAFNLNGDVRKLGTMPFPQHFYYIDAQRALVQPLTDEGNVDLLLATPDGLEVLYRELPRGYEPIAYAEPYVVMHPILAQTESATALLIDLSTLTVTELSVGAGIDTPRCCVFSADGSSLRYLARIDGAISQEADLQLRERALATGEETIFYETRIGSELTLAQFEPTSDGERWLVSQNMPMDEQRRRISVNFVSVDGTIEAVDDYVIPNEFIFHRVLGDALVRWRPLCEDGCDVSVTQADEYQFFQEGDFVLSQSNPAYLHEEALIWIDGLTIIRYSTEVEPQVLGYGDRTLVWRTGIQNNPRWSVVIDDEEAVVGEDPSNLLVWDHTQAEPVLTLPLSEGFTPVTDYDNFIVIFPATLEAPLTVVNTDSGAVIEWPPDEDGIRTQQILSDDRALAISNGAEIEAGIYLRERESGDLTLLVPGQLQLINFLDLQDLVGPYN